MIKLKHAFECDSGLTDYFEYEVDELIFYDEDEVAKLISWVFMDTYDVNRSAAYSILNNFDLWEDKGLLEEVLEKYMEELDEIFWDDDYWNEENEYKKDGAC